MRSTCCGWCSAHTAALRKKSLWRARILQGCRTKRRGRNQRSAAVPAAAATPEPERRKFVAPSRVRSRFGRDARAPESPRAARILPSHERPARPAANSPVPIPLPQIPLPNSAVLPSGSVQRRQPNHAGPSAHGAGTPAQVIGNPPCAIPSSLTATGDRSRSLGCGPAALCSSCFCAHLPRLDSTVTLAAGPAPAGEAEMERLTHQRGGASNAGIWELT